MENKQVLCRDINLHTNFHFVLKEPSEGEDTEL